MHRLGPLLPELERPIRRARLHDNERQQARAGGDGREERRQRRGRGLQLRVLEALGPDVRSIHVGATGDATAAHDRCLGELSNIFVLALCTTENVTILNPCIMMCAIYSCSERWRGSG